MGNLNRIDWHVRSKPNVLIFVTGKQFARLATRIGSGVVVVIGALRRDSLNVYNVHACGEPREELQTCAKLAATCSYSYMGESTGAGSSRSIDLFSSEIAAFPLFVFWCSVQRLAHTWKRAAPRAPSLVVEAVTVMRYFSSCPNMYQPLFDSTSGSCSLTGERRVPLFLSSIWH